jgi:DNA invertase Pin-like site-specific DNA recombinase
MNNKAILLARVSSREQEEGYSLSAQEKLILEYSQREKLNIAKRFVFVESAKDSNKRKIFAEMIDFLNKREDVNFLLCEKVDRLTRNFQDTVQVDSWLSKNEDNNVVFVKQNLAINKNSKSYDKFQWDISTVLAKNYINNLSDEIKKGMTEKAAEGIFPGAAPLGYMNKRTIVGKSDIRTIEVDPIKAPLIEKAFKYYATGNYSLKSLTKKLYEEGLVSRKGNKISLSGINEILKNPFYIGEYFWKGKKYKGTHPHLISPGLFDLVQVVLGVPTAGKQKKHYFTYRGLIKCGECGFGVTGDIAKNYIYYHCTHYKPCNQRHYTREESITEQILAMFDSLKIPPEVVEAVKEALKNSHSSEMNFHNRIIDDLKRRLESSQKRLDALYDDKVDGKISFEFYEKKLAEYSQERDNTLNQIAKYNGANLNYFEAGSNILALATKAKDIFLARTSEEKRQLLSFVVSKIILKDGKLEFEYKKPFDLLIDRAKSQKLWTLADSNR